MVKAGGDPAASGKNSFAMRDFGAFYVAQDNETPVTCVMPDTAPRSQRCHPCRPVGWQTPASQLTPYRPFASAFVAGGGILTRWRVVGADDRWRRCRALKGRVQTPSLPSHVRAAVLANGRPQRPAIVRRAVDAGGGAWPPPPPLSCDAYRSTGECAPIPSAPPGYALGTLTRAITNEEFYPLIHSDGAVQLRRHLEKDRAKGQDPAQSPYRDQQARVRITPPPPPLRMWPGGALNAAGNIRHRRCLPHQPPLSPPSPPTPYVPRPPQRPSSPRNIMPNLHRWTPPDVGWPEAHG